MAKNRPFIGLTLRVKKGMKAVLQVAADRLQEKILENASLTDHTLEDLRDLDHPYSVRNPRNIHRPKFKVHAQEGTLEGAIGQQSAGRNKITVGVDESKAPHARHVILGTSTMVARDFVTGSFKQVEDELRDIVGKGTKKVVKGNV